MVTRKEDAKLECVKGKHVRACVHVCVGERKSVRERERKKDVKSGQVVESQSERCRNTTRKGGERDRSSVVKKEEWRRESHWLHGITHKQASKHFWREWLRTRGSLPSAATKRERSDPNRWTRSLSPPPHTHSHTHAHTSVHSHKRSLTLTCKPNWKKGEGKRITVRKREVGAAKSLGERTRIKVLHQCTHPPHSLSPTKRLRRAAD